MLWKELLTENREYFYYFPYSNYLFVPLCVVLLRVSGFQAPGIVGDLYAALTPYEQWSVNYLTVWTSS